MNPWVLILCFAAALQVDRIASGIIGGLIGAWQLKRAKARLRAVGAMWVTPDMDIQMSMTPVSDKRKAAN